MPSSVFEWFVTIREGSSEVWSDWMDYEGYDLQATADDHAAAMRADVQAFLSTLVTCEGFRLRSVRELLVSGHKKAEWRINGEWLELALVQRTASATG